MKCLETPECWCSACVDRVFNEISQPKTNHSPSVPFVDVSTIYEYGLEQKLSNAIRCF